MSTGGSCAIPSIALATVVLVACHGESDPPPIAWGTPACVAVTGQRTLAFTPDSGATLVMPSETPVGAATEGVYAVVPLPGVPNRILAYHNGINARLITLPAIYRSDDAGCTWARATWLPTRGARLVQGGQDFALGWSEESGSTTVFVFDRRGRIAATATLAGSTVAIGASRSEPNRLRRVGVDHSIRESTNHGAVPWMTIAYAPIEIRFISAAAFDPTDIDRIAVGDRDVWITEDAGVAWRKAEFDGDPSARRILHDIAFSFDGTVIWAHGADSSEPAYRFGGSARHIWRSTDGGRTFVRVVDEGAETVIANRLVPHPQDPSRVYWSGGRFGDPTTHLYQYSSATGLVTRVELSDGSPFFDVHGFAFHPTDPAYIYFGLLWPGP